MFGKEKQGSQGNQGSQDSQGNQGNNKPQEVQMAKQETKVEVKQETATALVAAPAAGSDALVYIAPNEADRALLSTQLEACKAVNKDSFMKMFRQMNPCKPGMDADMDQRWSPARMRIHQAVSRDNIPTDSKLGDLYTSSGKQIKKPFRFTPIFFHRGRIMFVDNAFKCGSNDGHNNHDGIPCVQCPNNTTKNANGSAVCAHTLEVFAIDEANENTYILSFSKSGFLEGEKLRKLATSGEFPWEQWFTLDTKEEMTSSKRYFRYLVGATNDKVDPAVQRVLFTLSSFIQDGREKSKADLAQRKLLATTRVSDIGPAAGQSVPVVEGTPDFGGAL